jgi:hypothetical protein
MPEDLTPVEQGGRSMAAWTVAILALLAYVLVLFFFRRFNPDFPVIYTDIREHFKYGSIGGEMVNGLPYWIWKVLPEMFPEKLPAPGNGYAAFGFVFQPGNEIPIGLARRKIYIDRVGMNCAICHTGTVRDAASSVRQIYLGMPANTFDLQAYLRFLIACASDGRFTADNVVRQIKTRTRLDPLDELIYREAVYQTREGLLERARQTAFMASRPDWGPGRVDTFNPYKTVQFNFPMENDHSVGATDLPSIWNQKPRRGLQLHWDGNNDSMEERNKSAALGAGVTPVSIDLKSMKRIEDWLVDGLKPPKFPYAIDQSLAERGAPIYQRHCAECHDFGGSKIGKVTPIEEIATDRGRLDSFTYEFASNMNLLYAGYPWRFTHFRKTNGYANIPLDAVWLRSPFLHNGSVPTLRDLLESPDARPKTFYRGYDVYDARRGGFVSNVAVENGKRYFLFDASLPGNANGGHLYGIGLPAADKDALVEYLKGL